MFAAGWQKLRLFGLEDRTVLQCNKQRGDQAKEELEGAGTGMAGVEAVGLVTWGNTFPQIVRQGLFHLESRTPPPAAVLLSSSTFRSSARKLSAVVLRPFNHFSNFFFKTLTPAPGPLLTSPRHDMATAAALSSPVIYDGRRSRLVLPVALSAAFWTLQQEQKGRKKNAAGRLAPPQSCYWSLWQPNWWISCSHQVFGGQRGQSRHFVRRRRPIKKTLLFLCSLSDGLSGSRHFLVTARHQDQR